VIVADPRVPLPPSTQAVDDYRSGRSTFIVGLLPSFAVRMDVGQTITLLRDRFGDAVDLALEAAADPPAELPEHVRARLLSPVALEPDGDWLKRANVVGINVRTIGDVWSVVAYALTLPAVQSAIHLLPITEPGVAASLYGQASWQVDPAIRSERLANRYPALASAEAQLRAVVHLLHVMGRTVGMDVVPHTDRFSEIALAQPDHFEWLERRGDRIVRHGAEVTTAVEERIWSWLVETGMADGAFEDAVLASSPAVLFRELEERQRVGLLFGRADDSDGRRRRRIALVRVLHAAGYETVPATMGPPYRGIEVVPGAGGELVDELGLTWREFRMTEPTTMSRVFGPLARYHLYEPRQAGGWALDFHRPRTQVWRYVCQRYADLRDRIGFDFMRGDMSHVQMRSEGVAARVDDHYDLLGAVVGHVRDSGTPSFASLAESFLEAPGVMAYGAEADHLEMARADTALGDLQATAIDDPAFLRRLRWYRDLLATRSFAPSFTVMTADSDDPRFDGVYIRGNELRLFLGLFLADMPSYMSLGYEQRDVHLEPAPNEHYTKLYVFQLLRGPKATSGPYVFGTNRELFDRLSGIRVVADGLRDELARATVTWLCPPDATAGSRVMAWLLAGKPSHICLANLDLDNDAPPFGLPSRSLPTSLAWECLLSTAGTDLPMVAPEWNGRQWVVPGLGRGEGRVYRCTSPVP